MFFMYSKLSVYFFPYGTGKQTFIVYLYLIVYMHKI